TRILEVVEDRRALFLRHGGDEPHHQEERHHRGDEVRVRHFPGAAVMAAVAFLVALDDDDRAIVGRASHAETPRAYAAFAGGLPFNCASRSLNVGRTSL